MIYFLPKKMSDLFFILLQKFHKLFTKEKYREQSRVLLGDFLETTKKPEKKSFLWKRTSTSQKGEFVYIMVTFI